MKVLHCKIKTGIDKRGRVVTGARIIVMYRRRWNKLGKSNDFLDMSPK